MHLARTSISTLPRPQHNHIHISHSHFVLATDAGFELWQLQPLSFVLRRELPGSLSHASSYLDTSLFFLVGGGTSPVFAPNKVVVWDESTQSTVLELEFREKVLGLASRRGLLAVVFLKRVVLFELDEGFGRSSGAGSAGPGHTGKGKEREVRDGEESPKGRVLKRAGEWVTFENPQGLVALSTTLGSSLVAIPGRQAGHVHLLHLSPVPPSSSQPSPPPAQQPPPARSQILIAHTSSLSTLTCNPSGTLLSTTSSRGTLIRIYDGRTSALRRELRRGADQALMVQGGVAFSKGDAWLGGWSDKGTVHVFSLKEVGKVGAKGVGGEGEKQNKNRPSTLSKLIPYLPSPISLPKYFLSEWSHATYSLPSIARHSSTLASLGTTLARGTAGPSAVNALEEEDEGEEKCVLAWVDVDSPSSLSTSSMAGGRSASLPTDNHSVPSSPRPAGPRPTSSSSTSISERAVHRSSLSLPALGLEGRRERRFEVVHAPHRRDVDRPSSSSSTTGTRRSDVHHAPHHPRTGLKRSPIGHGRSPSDATAREGNRESQLVALTFSGGYYRLALPSSTSSRAREPSNEDQSRRSSSSRRPSLDVGGSDDDDGHGREDEQASEGKGEKGLRLVEYRRFGGGGFGFRSEQVGGEWNEVAEW